MSIFPPPCPLSVCYANLPTNAHICLEALLLWHLGRPHPSAHLIPRCHWYCCGTSPWHPLTFPRGFSLFYQTLHSAPVCCVFAGMLWSQPLNLPELSAYRVGLQKNNLKETQCCNDTKQLLHCFFSFPLFFVARLMGLSAEEVDCEITPQQRKINISFYSLLVIPFCS